jgi:hypothetical protein
VLWGNAVALLRYNLSPLRHWEKRFSQQGIETAGDPDFDVFGAIRVMSHRDEVVDRLGMGMLPSRIDCFV